LQKNLQKMTKIIGIGNALVDVLVHLEDETHLNRLQLPKGGMTHVDRPRYEELAAAVSTLPHKVATGGSAANAIHAMALLGDTVGFVGTVGADTMGTLFATCSRERGIDARLRVCDEGDTGVATTFITEDGERTFATYLGVAPQIEFQPDPDFIGDDAILHVEGYLVQDHDFIEHVRRTENVDGSCMMVVITDAPLDSRNLERVAKRAMMGLAKTGGIASNGSGDYVIAMSVAPDNLIDANAKTITSTVLANGEMSSLFAATIEATAEALWNSLFMAEPMTGRNGYHVDALPVEEVLQMLRNR